MQRLDVDRRRRHELLAEQTVDLGVREVIGQPVVEAPLAPGALRVLLERALGCSRLVVVVAVAAPGPVDQLPAPRPINAAKPSWKRSNANSSASSRCQH